MPVQKGDHVRVEYEGFLDDGRIFDSTEQHGFPLKLTIGAGVFLEAFECALIGMEVEEETGKQEVTVKVYHQGDFVLDMTTLKVEW